MEISGAQEISQSEGSFDKFREDRDQQETDAGPLAFGLMKTIYDTDEPNIYMTNEEVCTIVRLGFLIFL